MWPFRRRKRTSESDSAAQAEPASVSERLRDSIADSFPPGDGVTSVRVVTSGSTRLVVDGEEYDPNNPRHVQMMQLLESATGKDIDGDGEVVTRPAVTVNAATVTPPPPPANDWPAPDPDGDDPLERVEALERLAALHATGALTDDEFDAEKARILAGD